MADTKVSALTALGGTPATGDRLPVVDVSDTTMAASGTTKYVTYGELTTGLSATGHTHVEADITDLGTYLTDITGESIGDLSDVTLTTPAQGDILYRNATGWVNLPAGTSGQYLQTQGAGANPQWATLAGGGDMAAATYDPATISEQLVGLTATQTLTNKTLTTPTITLKQGAAPAPTAEGDIQWDTDDNRIAVGDGVGTVTFSNDTTNASTYAAASHAHAASDITSGTLTHERGGIEADISAITTGGILAGTGAGTMGIVSAAGKSDGDVLTLQADGTVAYETPAGGSGGPRGFTYVVAASDSRDATGADATCDGVADNVEIQAAIDAVATAGGGTVMLLDGTYEIDTVIGMKSNVCLMGNGYGTVLSRSDTTVLIQAGEAVTNSMIRDIRLDGNLQAAYAIDDGTSWNYCIFRNLWFEDVTSDWCVYGPSAIDNCDFWDIVINNCKSFATVDNFCTFRKVEYGKASRQSTSFPVIDCDTNATIDNCYITATSVSGSDGVVYCSSKSTVQNTYIENTAATVVINLAGQDSSAIGNTITGGSNANRIAIRSVASSAIISGNLISEHLGTGSWAISTDASFSSGNISITGNTIRSCSNGIRIVGGVEGYSVTGNGIHCQSSSGTALSTTNASTSTWGTCKSNGIQQGTSSIDKETKFAENVSGGVIGAGSVVARSVSSTDGEEITTTTTAGDDNVSGIACESISNATYGPILTEGNYTAALVDGSGTSVAVGDYLMTSTTAGKLVKATTGNTVIAIARAAVSTDTTALVEVIKPRLI